MVCASPEYLARAGRPRTPDALAGHACIAATGTTPMADRQTFPRERGPRRVAVRARLVVNTGQAAIDAAVAGVGVTRVLSYQVDHLVAAKRLELLLTRFEPRPVPVQIVRLPGAPHPVAAAFAELAAARLGARLASSRAVAPPRGRRARADRTARARS